MYMITFMLLLFLKFGVPAIIVLLKILVHMQAFPLSKLYRPCMERQLGNKTRVTIEELRLS